MKQELFTEKGRAKMNVNVKSKDQDPILKLESYEQINNSLRNMARNILLSYKGDYSRAIEHMIQELVDDSSSQEMKILAIKGIKSLLNDVAGSMRSEVKKDPTGVEVYRKPKRSMEAYTRVGQENILSLFDKYPIGGVMLGDCTKGHLASVADQHKKKAEGLEKSGNFYMSLSNKLNEGFTVRESMNETEVIKLGIECGVFLNKESTKSKSMRH